MSMVPANNIQLASVAGFIALCILHICKANDIEIPQDISEALPGVMIILIAHLSDIFTGDTKNGAKAQLLDQVTSAQ